MRWFTGQDSVFELKKVVALRHPLLTRHLESPAMVQKIVQAILEAAFVILEQAGIGWPASHSFGYLLTPEQLF